MWHRLMASLVLALVSCCAFGCEATGPRFREVVTVPEKATIYVYRQSGYQGSAVTLQMEVDKQKIGDLRPNGYVYSVVAPGSHMVSCSTESESAVEVIAKGGQSYYIEGDIVMGFWVGRPQLRMVAADLGRGNIGGKFYCGPEAGAPAPAAK